VIFYDNLYVNTDNEYDRRRLSVLLNSLKEKFVDHRFRDVLLSMPKPFADFNQTNIHETQVSVYDDCCRYRWHVDRFNNMLRHITMVYYFFKEPKGFKGGEVCFTNSPILEGKTVEKVSRWRRNLIKIKPKNNMAVLFDSTVPHCVFPTQCEDPEYARYSANCWIGYQ